MFPTALGVSAVVRRPGPTTHTPVPFLFFLFRVPRLLITRRKVFSDLHELVAHYKVEPDGRMLGALGYACRPLEQPAYLSHNTKDQLCLMTRHGRHVDIPRAAELRSPR